VKRGIEVGVLGGEHLDAFTDAVASLPDALRAQLRALEPELARLAIDGRWTVARFRDRLRAEVRRIEGDDGRARLARQRRDTGLRTWTDRDGMWRIAGRFDPASAIALQQRLAHQVEVRFRQARPPECPTDPLAAQDWRRAHALADLMSGLAGGGGATGVHRGDRPRHPAPRPVTTAHGSTVAPGSRCRSRSCWLWPAGPGSSRS
jgi:hypothetical protein